MATILKGSEVSLAMNAELLERVNVLKSKNIKPCLAIVRVGERGDDISYEKGAEKRCAGIGIEVKKYTLPESSTQDELLDVIYDINKSDEVHGCLMFRPLPKHFDEEAVRNALCPEKDVDGITDGSLAGVYAGEDKGFPPCTAAACMEILEHYSIDLKGKKAVVIGRSLVIGKPVSMMLLKKNATVTICHTKTVDMPAVCREAELLIVAAGRAKIVGKEYFSEGQTVIDVGINVDENGNLCGDVNFEEAEKTVAAISPVPGGVGTVTTAVLAKHLIEAAERTIK